MNSYDEEATKLWQEIKSNLPEGIPYHAWFKQSEYSDFARQTWKMVRISIPDDLTLYDMTEPRVDEWKSEDELIGAVTHGEFVRTHHGIWLKTLFNFERVRFPILPEPSRPLGNVACSHLEFLEHNHVWGVLSLKSDLLERCLRIEDHVLEQDRILKEQFLRDNPKPESEPELLEWKKKQDDYESRMRGYLNNLIYDAPSVSERYRKRYRKKIKEDFDYEDYGYYGYYEEDDEPEGDWERAEDIWYALEAKRKEVLDRMRQGIAGIVNEDYETPLISPFYRHHVPSFLELEPWRDPEELAWELANPDDEEDEEDCDEDEDEPESAV